MYLSETCVVRHLLSVCIHDLPLHLRGSTLLTLLSISIDLPDQQILPQRKSKLKAMTPFNTSACANLADATLVVDTLVHQLGLAQRQVVQYKDGIVELHKTIDATKASVAADKRLMVLDCKRLTERIRVLEAEAKERSTPSSESPLAALVNRSARMSKLSDDDGKRFTPTDSQRRSSSIACLQLVASELALKNAVDDRDAAREEIERLRAVLQNWRDEHSLQRTQFLALKNRIHVYCRLRPAADAGRKAFNLLGSGCLVANSATSMRDATSSKFDLDHVFSPRVANKDVFQGMSAFLGDVMNGTSVTLISYGQSGSGKSHTMLSKPDSLVPTMLIMLQTLIDPNIVLRAACVQFAKDVCTDCTTKSHRAVSTQGVSGRRSLCVKNGAAKREALEGRDLKDRDSILTFVRDIRKALVVKPTQMNEVSSRSNCILRIEVVNKDTETTRSQLAFIDMAGIEPAGSSNDTGWISADLFGLQQALSSYIQGGMLAANVSSRKVTTACCIRLVLSVFALTNGYHASSLTTLNGPSSQKRKSCFSLRFETMSNKLQSVETLKFAVDITKDRK